MIKKIVEETGAKIDIDDSGKVFIAAVNSESAAKAIDMITVSLLMLKLARFIPVKLPAL